MIAAYFNDGRPLYGLQPRGLHEGEDVHEDLQGMAKNCIEAMKSIQPDGPYLNGGHCAGGWVAYEMAYQLEQMGETVQYLGMVDMPAPDYALPEESRWNRIAKRLAYYTRGNRLLYAVV